MSGNRRARRHSIANDEAVELFNTSFQADALASAIMSDREFKVLQGHPVSSWILKRLILVSKLLMISVNHSVAMVSAMFNANISIRGLLLPLSVSSKGMAISSKQILFTYLAVLFPSITKSCSF